MKLRDKIIFLPIVITAIIFTIGMLTVEQQLKSTLKQRMEQELDVLASFALSAIDLVSYDFDRRLLDSSFDLLADRISQASDVRVSYFTRDGLLLGDSQISFAEIAKKHKYLDRPEILAALSKQNGLAQRYNEAQQQQMVYYAKYDANSQFIARIAVPDDRFHQAIMSVRLGFAVICLITIIAIIGFGIIAMRMIQQAVLEERGLQEARLIAHTKEITLVQTMSTLLNGIKNMEQAGGVLAKIVPKLLPNLSGAVFIHDDEPSTEMTLLSHWGNYHANEMVILVNKCCADKAASCQQAHNHGILNCDIHQCEYQPYLCYVPLIAEQKQFGLLAFIHPNETIDEPTQRVIQQLSEQISYGLINVQLKQKLRSQAIRDPLTALYNRRFLFEAFEPALNRAERYNRPLAVFMIDVDHFKRINDDFGHEVGDKVLSALAKIFRDKLRLEDIACRYGGEEFCLICPDTNLSAAEKLAEKLRLCVAELSLDGQVSPLSNITLSIGLSIFGEHAYSANQLIIQADKAMYRAKQQGRDQICVADVSGEVKPHYQRR